MRGARRKALLLNVRMRMCVRMRVRMRMRMCVRMRVRMRARARARARAYAHAHAVLGPLLAISLIAAGASQLKAVYGLAYITSEPEQS